MPRTARHQSFTGYYHVILRGINKQDIFESDEDYEYFYNLLSKYSGLSNFQFPAFALMPNHVHLFLVIDPETGEIGRILQRLTISFVSWYNRKYDRSGHLFEGRFHSIPIENERQSLLTFRYILQNPFNAGLESRVGSSYKWDSAFQMRTFCRRSDADFENFIHDFFLDLFSADKYFSGLQDFWKWIEDKSDDDPEYEIEPSYGRGISDLQAIGLMREITGCNDTAEFQKLPRNARMHYFRLLKDSGISVRQISRITGSSRGMISRVLAGK